nr:MAG TPA: hypothetical protein [Caudoviricetes sp.]
MYNDDYNSTMDKAVKEVLLIVSIAIMLGMIMMVVMVALLCRFNDKAIDNTNKVETNSNATAQVYYLHGSIISNENGIITIADTNGEAWEVESDDESLSVGVNVVMMMNNNNTVNNITDDTIINIYIQINS